MPLTQFSEPAHVSLIRAVPQSAFPIFQGLSSGAFAGEISLRACRGWDAELTAEASASEQRRL